MVKKEPVVISIQALRRMPYYLQYLKGLYQQEIKTVAAPAMAQHFGLNEVQVRKDLAAVSKVQGKPRAGFCVADLIRDMEEFLGCHIVDDAVLVGVGLLGKSLLSYKGFEEYGVKIVAAFDNDKKLVGTEIDNHKVLAAGTISDICRRLKTHIGIIAVPSTEAQIVCDQLIAGGVLAIWNFAPVHLSVPEHILVQNENMAASLALLSNHLREKMQM